MRAQSELLSSVILVTLTVVLGVAGFYLANSWALSRYSESSFTTFAELASNEFLVFPISFENRSSSIIAYIGFMRVGVLKDSYSVAVSIHSSSLYVQTQRWWALSQIGSGGLRYNISTIQASLYNLSFSPPQGSISPAPSNLYVKYIDGWYSLKDLGAPGITLYRIGTLSTGYVAFLNVTIPQNTKYIYVVIWAGYGERYIAIPSLISVS